MMKCSREDWKAYIVAGDVKLFKDVTNSGAMATEQIATDAELDSWDAVRSVSIEQVEHSARVTEDELFNDAVL